MAINTLVARGRKILRNPRLVNGAVRGGNFVLSLFLVPLQAKEFGSIDYAAIVLGTSAFAIIGLVDFGFAFSLQQDAATEDVMESAKIRRLMVDIVYTQSIFAFCSLFIAAIYIVNLDRFGSFVGSPRGRTIFALVLGWQLFSLAGASYWRWLLGSGRAARASVVANSQTFAVLALTLLAQLSGMKGIIRDVFLCAGYGSSGLIALVDVISSEGFRGRKGAFGRLKKYFVRSVGWTPLALINSICSQIPVIIISSRYSASAVAWYSIGTKLFNYPLSVAQITFFDYWPRLRLALNNNKSDEVLKSVRHSAFWLLLASGSFLAIAVTFSAAIFKLWHVPTEMVPDRVSLFGLGLTFIVTTSCIPITSALSALEIRFGQSMVLLISGAVTFGIGLIATRVSVFLVLYGVVGIATIPILWAAFVRYLPGYRRT